MKIISNRSKSHEISSGKSSKEPIFSQSNPDNSAALKTATVQRRTSCACGGGCPACRTKSNAKNNGVKVSQPNDPAELEADQVADRILQMPAGETVKGGEDSISPATIRRASGTHKNDEKTLQRKALPSANRVSTQVPSHVREAVGFGGKPLDPGTRSFFEPRIGYDLGNVRIHTGQSAERSTEAVAAKAYTIGNDIVFGSGEYQPQTASGKELLAHELAHVIQQSKENSFSIRRRTYRDDFATVLFLRGPLWNAHLTITHAPDDDTESLENFIYYCHEGIDNAVRSLGENPSATTREIRVRIRFNPRADEAAISHQAYDLAMASVPSPPAAGTARPVVTQPRVTHLQPDPSEAPQSGETDEQRLRRQANASIRELSNVVADAGSEGYNRVVLNIENNGREIIPGFSKEDQMRERPAHDQTSAATVHDTLGLYVDQFVQGSGRWQIIYTRQGNALSFSSYRRVPEVVPLSEEDELRALGIPNRREIYAQILQETQRQVIEAGSMVGRFAAEQLVFWMVGGVLFRGIGILGEAAFPRVMGLISRGVPSALGRVLEQTLSTSERAEFTVLMQRVESGALSTAEQARLSTLLGRVEAALPATATELMAGIRMPRIVRFGRGTATIDSELMRRAMEVRATQAGLSLEAFTSYNVAVARVRTASGEIIYLEAGNLPGAAHSEEYILAQLRERTSGLAGARVEQIFSERIPCSNCGDVISRFFGEDVNVFYAVGNQPNRGRLLMEAYGL